MTRVRLFHEFLAGIYKSKVAGARTGFSLDMLMRTSQKACILLNTTRYHSDWRNYRSSLPEAFLYTGCLAATLLVVKKKVKAAEKDAAEPKALQKTLGQEQLRRILREADTLYSQSEVDKLYDFLRTYDDATSAEIAWRQARAACDKAKHCEAKSEERKVLMKEGLKYAEKSMTLDDKCGPCHRWYAVMLNYVGDYEGNKEKIKYSYIVQQHFQQAMELDPTDATSMYCLGQWCYYFAEMSWYTKKIAGLIFGTPPTSTFQEALKYFSQAEESSGPKFLQYESHYASQNLHQIK
ncbi:regulator of microtubule dynamics protein 1-like isoform X2 [Watersipora subatra]|uniref:regulator of microtubule dynamics protein 1-like isoform X2 n=1 Tax=Watersipora subatra TaxID=2589382 RepID=UPI00355B45FC